MSSRQTPTFLILAHADPAMFHRLVGRLKNIGNIVAHIDARADISPFLNPAVTFTPTRISPQWAGFSLISAEIELLQTALHHFPASTHFSLLSGMDYPATSDREILSFYQNSIGQNHLKYIDLRTLPPLKKHQFHCYYLRDIFGSVGTSTVQRTLRHASEITLRLLGFRRRWPKNLIPCWGSMWWTLTPECARHLLNQSNTDPFWKNFFRYSFAPDEFFFQNLFANSPFARPENLVPANNLNIEHTAAIHHIHPSLSKTYTLADLPEILASQKLFVRKVTTAQSTPLLDALDRHASQ